MRRFACILFVCLTVVGCSSLKVDREFGVAQKNSWAKQIAYPESPYADQRVEGIAGITAEEIMTVHNRTFAEKAERAQIFQFDLQQ